MFRSLLIVLGFAMASNSAMAAVGSSPIPVHLAEIEAQARTVVLKKYFELVWVHGEPTTYNNLISNIGKYGQFWGNFGFSAEIGTADSRTFRCELNYIQISIEPMTGVLQYDQKQLNAKAVCTEIPFNE
ncbi:hypothetical protein [Bdellovibrio sp. HCB337]|uniref:hypothetical protein n=1 Tax=Bdellovibrio sp. HCB337 TaxID=3394358 RepID=UPI0039A4AC91